MSFKRFDPEDFVVSSDSITSTLWSTGTPTLTSFFTSSTQVASSAGNYYISVYNTSSTDQETQFDIVYADLLGSGSELYNTIVPGNSYSKTMYGQYRSMILEDENASFTFGNGTNVISGSHFWVLSIERARYKQSLFPGSLNLTLSGSGGIINLTDDSQDNPINTFIGSSRVLQLISGSNGTAGSLSNSGYVAGSGSYGLVFPDLGTIILNPYAISQSIQVAPSRSNNSDGLNPQTLFNAISLGAAFSLNSEETITSDYIFVRARNSEFNYSENPSFISGSTGEVIYDNFINAPQVYATTIGMYNDSNELLAVAKMSRPLLKDFTKEALVRVKLDF
jgi:uncharacterized protein YfiM (DUF2279 family)